MTALTNQANCWSGFRLRALKNMLLLEAIVLMPENQARKAFFDKKISGKKPEKLKNEQKKVGSWV